MMLAHGGGSIFNPYSGDPGPLAPYSNGRMGPMGPSRGSRVVNGRGIGTSGAGTSGDDPTGILGRSQLATSAPNLPSYFPFNFRIVVSPSAPMIQRAKPATFSFSALVTLVTTLLTRIQPQLSGATRTLRLLRSRSVSAMASQLLTRVRALVSSRTSSAQRTFGMVLLTQVLLLKL